MTHIPDEAVQAMPERIYASAPSSKGCVVSFDIPSLAYDIEYIRADIAVTHLSAPCAVEVKKLEWHNKLQRGEREGFICSTGGILSYSIMLSRFRVYGIEGEHDGAAEFKTLDEAKAAAQADFERRIISCVVTKPVDVAAVRRQAFEEGFENGVEQSLDALNAYDDITRNEAEKAIRKLKPDYRAISAAPTSEAGRAALAKGGGDE